MDKIAGDIGQLKAPPITTGALPSSSVADACTTANSGIEAAWLRMAMRCKRVSNIAKGGATNYEVTDQEFRDGLNAMSVDR
ncbi:hypothetical protein GCM10023318_56420 [Nocardia callitridis]|uniref:Uncharacterized protein n=2 Tax=Nocardia callitridis TaxID=648753 RepID=A0ABP9KY31_9NOCA